MVEEIFTTIMPSLMTKWKTGSIDMGNTLVTPLLVTQGRKISKKEEEEEEEGRKGETKSKKLVKKKVHNY